MALRPKGLLFDLDNTLVDRDAAFARWLGELDITVEARDEAIDRDESGLAPRRRVCAYLGDALGLDADEVWAMMKMGIAAAVRPDPEVTALVASFAEKMPIAVVSNGGSENQRAKLRAAELDGIFGERVVVSEELGTAKPAPAMFVRGLELIGCRPSEAAFVGDNPLNDIEGAAALGLASVWVSHGRVDTPRATATISTIAELPQVIDA